MHYFYRNPMSKRATIKDVARMAGVTHTTVSRVIHNDSRISDPTKTRVRLAMKSMGYQPNLVARGLVRNRTQVVALITPEIEIFSIPIVRSVAESCMKHNYAVMVFPTNTWIQESQSFERVSQNWLVDGILIYNLIWHEAVTEDIRGLQSRNIPFVFINKFLDKPEINAVGTDNFDSVSLLVDHLVGLGHRKFAILCGDLTSVDGRERQDAFHACLARHGLSLEADMSMCPFWHEEPAYEQAKRLLQRPDRPSVIFSCNDTMAVGAIRAAHELGLRVPEDVAISGFDDSELGRRCTPPLTTIRPSTFKVGVKAVELLMQVIQDPKHPPEQIRMKSELIIRQSTTG